MVGSAPPARGKMEKWDFPLGIVQQSLLLKLWSMNQQQQKHRKLAGNVDSQAHSCSTESASAPVKAAGESRALCLTASSRLPHRYWVPSCFRLFPP